MRKISRPLLITLAVVLVIVAISMGLAATHVSGDMDGSLMFFDHDLSDSAFGWVIAIPILLLVGIIVIAVCAGAALLTVATVVMAVVITVFALMLALTPVAIFLAIPLLAIYGLVKMCQRQPLQAA